MSASAGTLVCCFDRSPSIHASWAKFIQCCVVPTVAPGRNTALGHTSIVCISQISRLLFLVKILTTSSTKLHNQSDQPVDSVDTSTRERLTDGTGFVDENREEFWEFRLRSTDLQEQPPFLVIARIVVLFVPSGVVAPVALRPEPVRPSTARNYKGPEGPICDSRIFKIATCGLDTVVVAGHAAAIVITKSLSLFKPAPQGHPAASSQEQRTRPWPFCNCTQQASAG